MSRRALTGGEVERGSAANDFKDRLRAARLRAGLTQAALADGRYTKAYISALENGQSRPSIPALDFLAARLGVSPTELLYDRAGRWSRVEADLRLAAGDWQAALDAYDRLVEQEVRPVRLAEVQRGRAEALCRLDRPADAVIAAAEAAAAFAAHGLPAEAAMALYWQASALYRLENADEARALLRGVLDVARGGAGVEPDLEVRTLIALAMIDSRDGHPERALTYLGEARAQVDALDDRRRAAFLESLAISYRESGDYEAAVTAATQAVTYFRAAEDALEVAVLDNELALTHLALGTLERAQAHAAAAHERIAALGNTTLLANLLETEAQIALARGDPAAADRHAEEALVAAATSGNHKAWISAALTRGRIARQLGEPGRAVLILEAAIESAREHGRSAQARDCLVELSEVMADQGDTKRAYELAREALG
jgi:transcriptional regulator with XRE-family HTH domain